jgi:pimeloyl-ACP methyl ester carboxylesterase
VLIIHGRDDDEVTFRNAEDIAAARPSARLLPFDGLGHRNILFAPPVFRAVMNEFAPKQQTAAASRREAHADQREMRAG